METRTMVTTLDGFNFELKRADKPEKIRSQPDIALLHLPALDQSNSLNAAWLAGETLINPIDLEQWMPSYLSEQGYYLVVSLGQSIPTLVSRDIPVSYLQAVASPAAQAIEPATDFLAA